MYSYKVRQQVVKLKLSMWMIANRLQVLEPELHLNEKEKQEIRGVRPYAAEGYALVTVEGSSTICRYKDEYFIIPGIEKEVVFGLLLDVFDFYSSWEEKIRYLAGKMRFQEIIDSCYSVFYNPLLLLDANYKVMGMSKQFSENSVDSEWKYLCSNGFSSVQAVHVLQEKRRQAIFNSAISENTIHCQKLNENGCMNHSCKIRWEQEICGSLVLMEKKRSINEGDYIVLRLLADILAPYIGKMNFTAQYSWGNSVFSKLLSGEVVEEEVLDMQLQYYEWKRKDLYQVFLLVYKDCTEGDMMYRLLRSSLVQSVPFSVVEIHNREIVLLLNCNRQDPKEILERIENILYRNKVNCFASQPALGIEYISFLYHQAGATKKFAHQKEDKYYYDFCEVASGYILREVNNERKRLAFYPPIRFFWENGDKKDREALETLNVYLRNNQSPAETSRQLFIAKNTLNYRLKRLEEKLGLQMNDPEQCLYYLITLETLQALDDN